jgi:hypothetical protein
MDCYWSYHKRICSKESEKDEEEKHERMPLGKPYKLGRFQLHHRCDYVIDSVTVHFSSCCMLLTCPGRINVYLIC